MIKLEAIKKTITRWKKLKPERRGEYAFNCPSCYFCQYGIEKDAACECNVCPWYEHYDGCSAWYHYFVGSDTNEEAKMWRDTVIGMLLYLEEIYK